MDADNVRRVMLVEMTPEELAAIEDAYWRFDRRRKGINEWASVPQGERDAFKDEAIRLVKGYFNMKKMPKQPAPTEETAIVRMAREAGGRQANYHALYDHLSMSPGALERFAELARVDEREKLCRRLAALHDELSLASVAEVRMRNGR